MESEETRMVSPPITEDEVERSEKNSELGVLARRFNPPVNMKKTTGKKDMKKRLLLAIKKFRNEMKDINLMEQIFIESQQTDDMSRNELAGYYQEFERTLLGMDQGYSLLHLPENTFDMITKHIDRLSDRGCPIVVAGEVSSGKSTLLNLFLGEAKLPVSTLSCTGRICELAYGETPCAKLITADKQEIDIDIDKLDEFINMQGKDASFNKFDIVRLYVKVPFLKSGITLVDTPGIGHDYADSSIVKEYVKNNDVFGFIFTIQSIAAGGVNQQFRNLLHTLAGDDYKDKNGNAKLDPTAVMFVCSYWDSVPDDEKEKTKKYIIDTITKMPFMVGFCPEKQLYLLDSKGAYAAYEAGYIADDYDIVIDGMRDFFKVGQMRKLEQSYLWIETLLQRCLHSLRSFVCWASQQRKLAASSVESMYHDLDGFGFMVVNQLRTFAELMEVNIEKVRADIQTFLNMPEIQRKIRTWTKDQMKGVQKFAEVKEIFEYMLDELVDERISEVLLEWEMKYQKITDVQSQFAEAIYHTFRIYHQQLDVLERNLHCIDSTDSGDGLNQGRLEEFGEAMDEVKRFVVGINPGKKTDFKISYSVMHGHEIINGKGFQVRKKLHRFFTPKSERNVPNRYSATFQKDLLYHMEYRAQTVVQRLCTDDYTEAIVREQIVPLQKFFEEKAASFKMRLNQNLALVKNLSKNVDFVVGSNKWYETYTETLKNLFDNVWSFSFKYMKTQNYEDTELIPYDGKARTKLMAGGIYGQIELAHLKNSDTKVTVKYLQDTSGNLMRESEVYSLVSILKSVKKGPTCRIPVYMGTCYGKRALVFGGHLHTARSYFLSQMKPVAKDICEVMIIKFIQELADALHFIYMHKLVHIEVSADSILVMQVGSSVEPMLSALSEKKEVNLPSITHDVNNFIYLPPEVLKKDTNEMFSGWYRSTGDVYGLGLLIVELYYNQQDIFLEKKQVPLEDWMKVDDIGAELLHWAMDKGKGEPPTKWKQLIVQCLDTDPGERISISRVVKRLQKLSEFKSEASVRKSDWKSTLPAKELNLKSEKVIPPHMEPGERPTHRLVKKLAVRKASSGSGEGDDTMASLAVSHRALVEEADTSFSLVVKEAPDYALYNTGVAMRAATETLESEKYSIRDIVQVLGTCRPRYSTSPLVGMNEALRQKNLKTQLLWCDLPMVAGSDMLRKMTSEEKSRQEALFEIISSEASYLRNLEQVTEEILPHIRIYFQGSMETGDMKNLFSNISAVAEISKSFMNDLEQAWSVNCQVDLEELFHVLSDFLSKQHNRDTYIIYFSNHVHQRDKIRQLSKRLPDMWEYVKSIGRSQLSLMDGFLCLPIQRVPRYKILIDAVIKNISNEVYNGEIGEKIQNCLYHSKSLTELCDAAVKTMQDMQYMINLDKRMDFGNLKKVPVVSESHLAKRHGSVGRICPRTIFYPWPYNESWEIHCFTDMVFFCILSSDGQWFSSGTGSQLAVKVYCASDKVLASVLTPTRAKSMNGDELPDNCDYILHVVLPDDAVGDTKDMLFSFRDESELLRWVEVLCPHKFTLKGRGPELQQKDDSPLVIVMRSYQGKDAGEMSLYEGEIIKIIKKAHFTDWTYGQKTGDATRGWFPMSHTKEIDCLHKRQKLMVQQQMLLEKTTEIMQTRAPVRSYDMDDLLRLTSAMSEERTQLP